MAARHGYMSIVTSKYPASVCAVEPCVTLRKKIMWTWIVLVERSTLTGRKAATLVTSERWDAKWKAEANLEAHVNQTPPQIDGWLQGDTITDMQVVWVAR